MPLRTIVAIFYIKKQCATMTHLDFGGCDAGAAVHSLQGDRVELALVQVDHGQLAGLVGRRQRSSKGELELIPESLRWGAGVRVGVDRAVLVFREGVAIGQSLESTKGHLLIKGTFRKLGSDFE